MLTNRKEVNMNNGSITPKDLRRAVDQHFAQTPADEVVRRAEELRPPLENENGLAYCWVMKWVRPKPGT